MLLMGMLSDPQRQPLLLMQTRAQAITRAPHHIGIVSHGCAQFPDNVDACDVGRLMGTIFSLLESDLSMYCVMMSK